MFCRLVYKTSLHHAVLGDPVSGNGYLTIWIHQQKILYILGHWGRGLSACGGRSCSISSWGWFFSPHSDIREWNLQPYTDLLDYGLKIAFSPVGLVLLLILFSCKTMAKWRSKYLEKILCFPSNKSKTNLKAFFVYLTIKHSHFIWK